MSAVAVWINRSGKLAGPPAPAAGVARQVLLAVLAASLSLSILLLVLWAYAGVFLNWRRMAAWAPTGRRPSRNGPGRR